MISPLKLPGLYCGGVLPINYGEELSEMEILCKLVAKVDEIVKYANGELSQDIVDYIEAHFNDFMVEAIYDPKTETIILKERK